MAFVACGSTLLMTIGGPGGARSPQVPRGGMCRVGGVLGGKRSGDLTHCQQFPDSTMTAITQLPGGVLQGLKGCLAASLGPFLTVDG